MQEVNKEKNQITAFDVIMTALAVLAFLPVLPFNILFILFIWKTNRKENFVLFPCIALLAILFSKIGLFIEETIQIAVTLVKGIFNNSFNILAYGQYSLTSWLILTALSFAVASYMVKRLRYNRKKEQVGIVSLERQFTKYGGGRYDYTY